ncbi:NnrS family protein [Sulfuriflexus sp.]|uniref:NnrS family protein n=1 Tax=Sulfuriflexus sp. TaxID=2015443 RepID=UPI0028CEE102|nr:NnrS family protein [Sulfuriflexus sp.]MDT8403425.1 NnrS family protein [Sulfuriflexus sp.]
MHAFTVGGIGLMARIALGHTGRNVFEPPLTVILMFSLLLMSAFIRVVQSLIDATHYTLWNCVSQVFQILNFVVFSASYILILIRHRVDGVQVRYSVIQEMTVTII